MFKFLKLFVKVQHECSVMKNVMLGNIPYWGTRVIFVGIVMIIVMRCGQVSSLFQMYMLSYRQYKWHQLHWFKTYLLYQSWDGEVHKQSNSAWEEASNVRFYVNLVKLSIYRKLGTCFVERCLNKVWTLWFCWDEQTSNQLVVKFVLQSPKVWWSHLNEEILIFIFSSFVSFQITSVHYSCIIKSKKAELWWTLQAKADKWERPS